MLKKMLLIACLNAFIKCCHVTEFELANLIFDMLIGNKFISKDKVAESIQPVQGPINHCKLEENLITISNQLSPQGRVNRLFTYTYDLNRKDPDYIFHLEINEKYLTKGVPKNYWEYIFDEDFLNLLYDLEGQHTSQLYKKAKKPEVSKPKPFERFNSHLITESILPNSMSFTSRS